MNYYRIRSLVLLLLPLVAAHALLPTGFMVSFEHGAPTLVFCEGQASIQGHEHHQHHHHAATNSSSEAGLGGSLCPFALAAAAAPPVMADFVVARAIRISQPIVTESISVVIDHSIASPPIRGPPAFF